MEAQPPEATSPRLELDLSEFELDFEDAETVVRYRLPPLVLPLARRVDAWIDELPDDARRVLEEARARSPRWPVAPRPHGAVAMPVARPRPAFDPDAFAAITLVERRHTVTALRHL